MLQMIQMMAVKFSVVDFESGTWIETDSEKWLHLYGLCTYKTNACTNMHQIFRKDSHKVSPGKRKVGKL